MKHAFFSSNSTETSLLSPGRTFFSNEAGFFGKIKDESVSALASVLRYLTSLCASDATKVRLSGDSSIKIPFITGRNSSSAVAKIVLVMPARSTSGAILKDIFCSSFKPGNCGKSLPFWPTILNFPVSELITIARLSGLISKVNGCSENSFKASVSILAGIAILPSSEAFSRTTLVIRVDSRSEAVISNSFLLNLNKKLSKIGNVFFELITLLTTCK